MSSEPAARPNVITILFDDLGFAQLGCFGADIATPSVDRLAASGLAYNRFHVTALCSPTRASLLTGRNHHAVGVGFLVDVPFAEPGYSARLPKTAACLPRILRDHDYATMAVGKWHLTPMGERSHAGPFDQWPLGVGFETYYGFLQGDTNQWTPNLVRDNHYVDPPARPEDGYHLSEDLADAAIRSIVDRRQAAPGRPFYLYFALGATHSPHHVPRQWADRYAGAFDEGWDVWRERAFARQLELGIVPAGTTLPPRPPWVPAWDDLPAPQRRLFARMHEVYAGFVSHADHQIGRIVDSLADAGILDDTVVMVTSDNGASAEGGQSGTHNEHRFSVHLPDSVEGNLEFLDDWHGHSTFGHYAWGWAWAGNTPLRLWKRYTWLGGCRTPLVVHWPAGIGARGEVREQFCHVVDVMPTILDVCGIEPPATVDGIAQQQIDGASMAGSFDDPAAAAPRQVQYFEMLGSRSIVCGEWKATTDHVSHGVADEEALLEGSRDFDGDRWGLFHLPSDFAEAHDLADERPEVLAGLIGLWEQEAQRNNVLPLADSLTDRLDKIVWPRWRPDSPATFTPAGSPPRDESVPRITWGGRVTAHVVAGADPEGVLCALGDWLSGYALFISDGRAQAALAVGSEATLLAADEPLGPGEHAIGFSVRRVAGGTELTLEIDGRAVESTTAAHELPVSWQHGGTALWLGRDEGFPVSAAYQPPFPFNGVLHKVVVESGDNGEPPPLDLGTALHAD